MELALMNRKELDRERDSRAGCLILRRTRAGVLVGLYRASEAGLDVESGPYATVCEDHGAIMHYATRKDAERFLPEPCNWCEDCQAKSTAETED